MASSTVLRVKRRAEDNPQDALVLLCKKIKKEEADSEEISPSVFFFTCSVKDQDPQIKKIIPDKKPTKTNKPQRNIEDILQKIRKERKDVAAESRYEIVNCSRGLTGNFVDLQKKDDQDDEQFIYDIYTSTKQDFDISMVDNVVSIEHYETDNEFTSYRDTELPSSDDSEDSNAENDWRNDYPDSASSSMEDYDPLVKAVQNCDLEEELSSDAGEENIYDEPLDLFNEDVKRYGEAYAKYKARVLTEEPDLTDSYVHCNVDSYKDDSDDGFYYGQENDSEQFREQYDADLSDPD